jgi:hypothetical protein
VLQLEVLPEGWVALSTPTACNTRFEPEYCELRWWRGLIYYARQNKMFLATCMKDLQRVSPGIPFHEEAAPTHFPVFTNCLSTRYFYVVLNSLKPVVVHEEVQCFEFPLPRDIKHKQWMQDFLQFFMRRKGAKSRLLSTQKFWTYSNMLATLLKSTANMQSVLQRR